MVGNTLTKFNINLKPVTNKVYNISKVTDNTQPYTFEINGYKDEAGTITADNDKYAVTLNTAKMSTSPKITWGTSGSEENKITVNLPNAENPTTYYYTLTHSGEQVEQNRYDNNNPLTGDIGSAEERQDRILCDSGI